MTSVDGIVRLFKAAHYGHMNVDDAPSNDHIISYKEDILNMYLQIVFEGEDTGDLSGAILEDARYKRVSMSRTPYDRQLAARNNCDYSISVDNPLFQSKE